MYKSSPMHVERQPAAFNANPHKERKLEIKECKETYETLLAAASLALFADERPRTSNSNSSSAARPTSTAVAATAAARPGAAEKVRTSGVQGRKVTFAEEAAAAPAPAPAQPTVAPAPVMEEGPTRVHAAVVDADVPAPAPAPQPVLPRASAWTVEVDGGNGGGKRGAPFSLSVPAPAPAPVPVPAAVPAAAASAAVAAETLAVAVTPPPPPPPSAAAAADATPESPSRSEMHRFVTFLNGYIAAVDGARRDNVPSLELAVARVVGNSGSSIGSSSSGGKGSGGGADGPVGVWLEHVTAQRCADAAAFDDFYDDVMAKHKELLRSGKLSVRSPTHADPPLAFGIDDAAAQTT